MEMQRVSPLLGKKRSRVQKQILREGHAARRAKGLPLGRPRRAPRLIHICHECNTIFARTLIKNGAGKYCSNACCLEVLHRRHQKLPPVDKLRELYVVQGMSLWQIARLYGVSSHSPVRQALINAGIPRRDRVYITSGAAFA